MRLALCCVLLICFAAILRADQYEFNPMADAFVKAKWPDRNYGHKRKLKTDGSPILNSYIRFQATGIVGTIVSARLRIHVLRGNPEGLFVHSVSSGWDERTLTYNTQPDLGSVVGVSGPVADETWFEVSLSILPGKDGILNLALTSAHRKAIRLYSRESPTPPRLIVETIVPAEPVIASAGDISCDPASDSFNNGDGTATSCHMRATSDLLLETPDLASVLLLGDNQYEDGTLAQYETSFDLFWGRVKSLIHPAPGNHEYNLPGATGYFDYFGVPAGDPDKGYYSFNIGAWHIVSLNSNCAFVGGCGPGSPQEQWLRADLAANSAACTLAYWHHPRYSSGLHGSNPNMAPLWQALYDANAEVILSGHDHLYERFAPQDANGNVDSVSGLRQFVVGTGGKNLYDYGVIAPNSQVRRNDTFGILTLTLKSDRYTWTFVPEAGSTFSDTGTTVCH